MPRLRKTMSVHGCVMIREFLHGDVCTGDTDSDSFIAFRIEQTGHVEITGLVGGTQEDHSLKFKFQTD
jgi:hypothetical protein